jgi:pimeloyl-ACP methyl ester carboxylesterase
MTPRPHVFYLHGFASSARSGKAAFFADRLARHGIELHSPDFNEPDFETMTVSRMIAQTEAAIATVPAGPVVLIGSSLGGFVAFHVAARQPLQAERAYAAAHSIDRLVLLAPAFDFGRTSTLGVDAAGLERWRATDRLDVFHHGEGRTRFIRFAIHEDALRYDSAACALDIPALVFQGTRDTLVSPAMVREFVSRRPAMTLRLVDDDHRLMSSLDVIWDETSAFLGLSGEAGATPGA